jgi:hypothetical protein
MEPQKQQLPEYKIFRYYIEVVAHKRTNYKYNTENHGIHYK